MRIVHLEDDTLYAEYIGFELLEFAAEDRVKLKIRHIPTEREFSEKLAELMKEGDIFLLDVMVRWSYPEDDDTAEVLTKLPGAYYDAGLRCAKLLLENLPIDSTKTILLYTVYQREEIGKELAELRKIQGNHVLELITKGENVEEVWRAIMPPKDK